MEKDLEANSEFRVKYPRGELGQSSGESELFMLMEHMSGVVKDIETELKSMRNNSININFLKEQVAKLNEDVESLKDADRDMKYINGEKDEWSK